MFLTDQVDPANSIMSCSTPKGQRLGCGGYAPRFSGQGRQGRAVGVGDNHPEIGGLKHFYIIGGIAQGNGMAGAKAGNDIGHLVCFGLAKGERQETTARTRSDPVSGQLCNKAVLRVIPSSPNARLRESPRFGAVGILQGQARAIGNLLGGHIAKPSELRPQLWVGLVQGLQKAGVMRRGAVAQKARAILDNCGPMAQPHLRLQRGDLGACFAAGQNKRRIEGFQPLNHGLRRAPVIARVIQQCSIEIREDNKGAGLGHIYSLEDVACARNPAIPPRRRCLGWGIQ